MARSKKINKKIIFFTNADWHFYNHLLPLALEAKNRGYEVKIATTEGKYKTKIEKAGLNLLPFKMSRNGMNPFIELGALVRLFFLLNREKPDILANFTLKPILYGTIISLFARVPKVVNTFLGMGYLFISKNPFISLLRYIYCGLLFVPAFLKKSLFIVQNEDDKKLLTSMKLAKSDRIIKQCCVGIHLDQFELASFSKGKLVFTLMSRMLKDKGVLEFIEAAKMLNSLKAEFWLVGMPDPSNNASLDEMFLKKLHRDGHIKYLGYQQDIQKIWKKSHIAVLPSYREGLSRSLLEAGSMGRPIITTDAPGGRELVEHKEDGLLVPVKDAEALADEMKRLFEDKALRKKLSENMRKKIVENYDVDYIAKRVIDLYGE